ncbi:MAG: PIN domain-containing protein [Chloroflexota bacterium]
MRPDHGCLVLDAGGLLAVAAGDARARAALEIARRRQMAIVVPTPVIVQVHRGGRRGERVAAALDRIDGALPTSERVARIAGELLGAAGTGDAVDAIVVAEALAGGPSMILTSDPGDLARLIGDRAARPAIAILGV